MTCQCCLQKSETPTCDLCGWKADVVNTRGYSKLNRQVIGKYRSEFIRSLPGRIQAALQQATG